MAKLVGRLPDGRLVVQFKSPGVEVLDPQLWLECRTCGEVWAGNVHRCNPLDIEAKMRGPIKSVKENK